ncbi:MAG: hypothetical protein H6623_01430 [Bdellovibrionaceae bacterium]|nr:hypothetical protein [Pseudobdellovibrionaceae bacterium]
MKKPILITLVVLTLIVFLNKKRDTKNSEEPISSIPRSVSHLFSTKNRNPITTQKTTAPRLPANVPSDIEIEAQMIIDTNKCYDTQICNYPQTDPRSYEVALGKDIAKKLQQFRLKYKNNSDVQKWKEQIARKFIKSFDGFVQEEALKMFSELPIASENLQAITQGLQNSPDALLIKLAIPELQRYLGSSYESQVHTFLSSTIATGAHFSSEVVTENIGPFISNSSYNVYKQTAQQLPQGSSALRNLSTALRDYALQQTGA